MRFPTERSNVKVEIYDMFGRQVAVLVHEEQEARFTEASWNADVRSGIYFYRISAVAVANPGRTFHHVRKIVILR